MYQFLPPFSFSLVRIAAAKAIAPYISSFLLASYVLFVVVIAIS
jgi:hypothetical protein